MLYWKFFISCTQMEWNDFQKRWNSMNSNVGIFVLLQYWLAVWNAILFNKKFTIIILRWEKLFILIIKDAKILNICQDYIGKIIC